MKNVISILSFLVLNVSLLAQVPKNIVVEHFTNTVCSICATKNPQLNDNLSNNTNLLRISYHPSSPYSSCLLNQHNVSGNDARTNYYNVYGATPRIVIQGNVESPSINFSNSTIFDDYKDEFTYLKLNLILDSTSIADSIKLRVMTQLVSPIPVGVNSHSLYVGIAEDTIFYSSPNGESTHKNVFRKALNGNSGSIISIPVIVGDSIVKEYTLAKDSEWNIGRVFGYAIVQDPISKSVKQVASSSFVFDNTLLSVESKNSESLELLITQSSDLLRIETSGVENESTYKIYGINGELVLKGSHFNNLSLISISILPSSLYILKIEGEKGGVSKKFFKVN
jgi:hypothetical protein